MLTSSFPMLEIAGQRLGFTPATQTSDQITPATHSHNEFPIPVNKGA